MRASSQLAESIKDTFCLLFLVHLVIFASVSRVIMLGDLATIVIAGPISLCYYATARALLRSEDMFVGVPSYEPIHRLNAALVLTVFRLTSIPWILLYIVLLEQYSVLPMLIVYCVLAFLSDLLDGMLARGLNQRSVIGAYLDSLSDYAILLALSVAFALFTVLPLWYLAAVMLRLLLQLMLALVTAIRKGRIGKHQSSLLAKASIFLVMLVYALALLQFVPAIAPTMQRVLLVFSWGSFSVLVLSAIEKIVLFFKVQ